MPYSAGYTVLTVADPELALTLPVLAFYPTAAPEQPTPLGSYQLSLAPEALPAPGPLPLVLLSHGTGGTPLVYRDLARDLARRGFVVGLPEHPHNHRLDNRWAGTTHNLAARPRHLRLAADALFAHPALGAHLRPGELGLIGHSMGGYSALALAGGQPTSFPHEAADGQVHAVPVAADARVRALVLLAPATPWFREPGALRAVRVPILLLTGEKDEAAPAQHGQWVLAGVPDPAQVEHRVIEKAGHFAFLTPFPADLTRPDFPPSQDPPGFDRAAFQPVLHAEVGAFLTRWLQH